MKIKEPKNVEERLRMRGIRASVTHARDHTSDRGHMTTLIDFRRASDEQTKQMAKAIAKFIPKITIRRTSRRIMDGKAKWYPTDDKVRVTDVMSARLVLHETAGSMKGNLLEEPFMVTVLGSGRKYYISERGKPLRTCQFCDKHHEPLVYGRKTKKYFHQDCRKARQRQLAEDNAKQMQLRVEV